MRLMSDWSVPCAVDIPDFIAVVSYSSGSDELHHGLCVFSWPDRFLIVLTLNLHPRLIRVVHWFGLFPAFELRSRALIRKLNTSFSLEWYYGSTRRTKGIKIQPC